MRWSLLILDVQFATALHILTDFFLHFLIRFRSPKPEIDFCCSRMCAKFGDGSKMPAVRGQVVKWIERETHGAQFNKIQQSIRAAIQHCVHSTRID